MVDKVISALKKLNGQLIGSHKVNNHGFSLVELMAVIAIVGIIALIGTPKLLAMRTKSSVRADSRDVYSILRQAQTEAVKRNINVCFNISGDTYKVYDTGGDITTKELRPGNSFTNNTLTPDPCFNARGLPSITQNRSVELINSALTLTVELTPAGLVSVPTDLVVVH